MGLVLQIKVMEVVDVIIVSIQIRPAEPANIRCLSAVEVTHAPQRVCANDVAPLNITFMPVTLDTSQLEMAPLKDVAW